LFLELTLIVLPELVLVKLTGGILQDKRIIKPLPYRFGYGAIAAWNRDLN
jgi:hypothetical protein